MHNNGSAAIDGDENGRKLEELRRRFFADEDLVATRLETLMEKIVRYCSVDKHGNVHLTAEVDGAKNRIQLVLSARAVAARLDSQIAEDVSIAEMAEATGLGKDQVSARCAELVKARSIDSSRRGTFRIRQERIERFLDSLGE